MFDQTIKNEFDFSLEHLVIQAIQKKILDKKFIFYNIQNWKNVEELKIKLWPLLLKEINDNGLTMYDEDLIYDDEELQLVTSFGLENETLNLGLTYFGVTFKIKIILEQNLSQANHLEALLKWFQYDNEDKIHLWPSHSLKINMTDLMNDFMSEKAKDIKLKVNNQIIDAATLKLNIVAINYEQLATKKVTFFIEDNLKIHKYQMFIEFDLDEKIIANELKNQLSQFTFLFLYQEHENWLKKAPLEDWLKDFNQKINNKIYLEKYSSNIKISDLQWDIELSSLKKMKLFSWTNTINFPLKCKVIDREIKFIYPFHLEENVNIYNEINDFFQQKYDWNITTDDNGLTTMQILNQKFIENFQNSNYYLGDNSLSLIKFDLLANNYNDFNTADKSHWQIALKINNQLICHPKLENLWLYLINVQPKPQYLLNKLMGLLPKLLHNWNSNETWQDVLEYYETKIFQVIKFDFPLSLKLKNHIPVNHLPSGTTSEILIIKIDHLEKEFEFTIKDVEESNSDFLSRIAKQFAKNELLTFTTDQTITDIENYINKKINKYNPHNINFDLILLDDIKWSKVTIDLNMKILQFKIVVLDNEIIITIQLHVYTGPHDHDYAVNQIMKYFGNKIDVASLEISQDSLIGDVVRAIKNHLIHNDILKINNFRLRIEIDNDSSIENEIIGEWTEPIKLWIKVDNEVISDYRFDKWIALQIFNLANGFNQIFELISSQLSFNISNFTTNQTWLEVQKKLNQQIQEILNNLNFNVEVKILHVELNELLKIDSTKFTANIMITNLNNHQLKNKQYNFILENVNVDPKQILMAAQSFFEQKYDWNLDTNITFEHAISIALEHLLTSFNFKINLQKQPIQLLVANNLLNYNKLQFNQNEIKVILKINTAQQPIIAKNFNLKLINVQISTNDILELAENQLRVISNQKFSNFNLKSRWQDVYNVFKQNLEKINQTYSANLYLLFDKDLSANLSDWNYQIDIKIIDLTTNTWRLFTYDLVIQNIYNILIINYVNNFLNNQISIQILQDATIENVRERGKNVLFLVKKIILLEIKNKMSLTIDQQITLERDMNLLNKDQDNEVVESYNKQHVLQTISYKILIKYQNNTSLSWLNIKIDYSLSQWAHFFLDDVFTLLDNKKITGWKFTSTWNDFANYINNRIGELKSNNIPYEVEFFYLNQRIGENYKTIWKWFDDANVNEVILWIRIVNITKKIKLLFDPQDSSFEKIKAELFNILGNQKIWYVDHNHFFKNWLATKLNNSLIENSARQRFLLFYFNKDDKFDNCQGLMPINYFIEELFWSSLYENISSQSIAIDETFKVNFKIPNLGITPALYLDQVVAQLHQADVFNALPNATYQDVIDYIQQLIANIPNPEHYSIQFFLVNPYTFNYIDWRKFISQGQSQILIRIIYKYSSKKQLDLIPLKINN